MDKSRRSSIVDFFSDRLTSEWKLLSDTENFLSMTPDFSAYERQFQTWRKQLQTRGLPDTELVTLRSQIIALRKELRLQGYDLSLGAQRLLVHGFLNDDSISKGYQRVVICFCDPSVYFWTGTANHVELASELENALIRKNLLNHPEMHYLWFLRTSEALYISGAATESLENFIRFEERAQANPLKLLATLKGLF